MDIVLSEDEQRKLVDAINKMLPLIPDSELEIEVIEFPEGGAEYRYHMSERVQAIFENLAFLRGMTINEYLKWTVLPNSKN
ncbi:MAG TPA: hypothetical protein PLC55_10585 [Zoogloea sp.]|nr:hypothetical protein [Bacillota bacterium]HQE39733.1 hypothetical protein [Zoogloea sp.]